MCKGIFNLKRGFHWNLLRYCLLSILVFCADFSYAGGSIFGGGKHKQANPYGVYSIGIHICSSLECPPIRIVEGLCTGEHMEKRWGVCICDEGFIAKGSECVINDKQSIDGWIKNENDNCESGSHSGVCTVCLSVENTVSSEGVNEFWADSNALCKANEMCGEGVCHPLKGSGCVKNSDCINKKTISGDECKDNRCYCNYGNSYKEITPPTETGTCALNNKHIEFFYGDDHVRRIAVQTDQDLWSSKNYCESLKMRLMTWNELNCTLNEKAKTVVLNYQNGTHLKDAFNTIYSESTSGFFRVMGYTTEYALVRIGPTIMDIYSESSIPYFFCR